VLEVVVPVRLKVILELHHLTDAEIETAANIVASSGAAFVKTGTGWTPAAATLPRIRPIAAVVAGRAGIKASGGIRDLPTVAEMVAIGVTRFGINTASAIELVRGIDALPGQRLVIAPPASTATCSRKSCPRPRSSARSCPGLPPNLACRPTSWSWPAASAWRSAPAPFPKAISTARWAPRAG
jgi:hypothetical protein